MARLPQRPVSGRHQLEWVAKLEVTRLGIVTAWRADENEGGMGICEISSVV